MAEFTKRGLRQGLQGDGCGHKKLQRHGLAEIQLGCPHSKHGCMADEAHPSPARAKKMFKVEHAEHS
eukprot:51397-Pelagomonas_calceolata.AAC.3